MTAVEDEAEAAAGVEGAKPLAPTIPEVTQGVGGCLIFNANMWPKINPDAWVLRTVSEGYKIEFTKAPPARAVIRKTPLPKEKLKSTLLLDEVSALLIKNAITPLSPQYEEEEGFWSTLFLAPKKNGEWRPILNLKPLNQYIKPNRFSLETLKTVMSSPIKGKWATSVDLRDAYLHVPIHSSDRKWLRFFIQGKAYEFRCPPFGLSTSPRVFTRKVKAVAAFLRRQEIQIHVYLDDWIIASSSSEEAKGHLKIVMDTISDLEFIVNTKKSNLVPSQTPIFSGARLHLTHGLATPSTDRVPNMIRCAGILKQSDSAPAIAWIKVLGLMASLVDLVPWYCFHMRLIHLHLLYHYCLTRDHPNVMVPMTDIGAVLVRETQQPNSGCCLSPTSLSNHSDDRCIATRLGRSHVLPQSQRYMSKTEAQVHINLLELWAVFRSFQCFKIKVQGKTFLVKTDNSIVVAYINRQEGTKSPTLCLHTRELLRWCI